MQVFAEFGFPDLCLSEQDFLEEEIVVEIGREPLKIQVLTGIVGVTFEQSYNGKIDLEIGDRKVPFIR